MLLPEIHTSDRALYRRCRRKWDLRSPLRRGLVPWGETNEALWFGSAFHYALEDYHGARHFSDPHAALTAYYDATFDAAPFNADELLELGRGMLTHYTRYWLPERERLETLVIDGVPQTEVRFSIPLTTNTGADFLYVGTIDRVAVDAFGLLWLIDYKTAGRMDQIDMNTDPQTSNYSWAADRHYATLYGATSVPPIAGFIIQTHLKAVPEVPRIVKGNRLSTDKRLHTTHALYTQAIMDHHGSVLPEYSEMLTELASRETPDGDPFVKRTSIARSDYNKQREGWAIIIEATEMLNSELPIYPNFTRDCRWDCKDAREACLSIEDGVGDPLDFFLPDRVSFTDRSAWRTKLVLPNGTALGMVV